jgi:hypothetical protein
VMCDKGKNTQKGLNGSQTYDRPNSLFLKRTCCVLVLKIPKVNKVAHKCIGNEKIPLKTERETKWKCTIFAMCFGMIGKDPMRTRIAITDPSVKKYNVHSK